MVASWKRSSPSPRASPIRSSHTGHIPAIWSSWRYLAAAAPLRVLRLVRWSSSCCRILSCRSRSTGALSWAAYWCCWWFSCRRVCRAPSSLLSPAGAREGDEMQPERAAAADPAPLFETINVSRRFGAFKALTDISFRVSDGEFVSIVGPNGAGKTTLVNVVTGLLRPTVGEVRFLGRDIAGVGPVELARLGMARAFQLVNIFPALTVRETVAVASRLRRVSNPFRSLKRDAVLQADTERVAEVLGLRSKLDIVASTLSQGEKKLLDIASAFALNPTVILLDEPTSGVSTGDKHAIMEVLVTAARAARHGPGRALLASHRGAAG